LKLDCEIVYAHYSVTWLDAGELLRSCKVLVSEFSSLRAGF
jgi:hypothetical protein